MLEAAETLQARTKIRRPASSGGYPPGGFDGAIRDFGDFENWVNFVRDAHEFVFLFERPQEIPQIAISHFPSLYRSMNPKPDTLTRASGAAHCAGRFEAMEHLDGTKCFRAVHR